MRRGSPLLLTVALLGGCASVQVPPNVQLFQRGDGAGMIEAIDFSYIPEKLPEFGKLKLCVAQSVQNDSTVLHGGKTIYTPFGTVTGRESDVVGGGSVFKYIDDEHQQLVASGTASGGTDPLGIVSYKIRYQLQAGLQGGSVQLRFSDIKQAATDSGTMENSGFTPVGTWAGGRAMKVYSAVQMEAENVKACVAR